MNGIAPLSTKKKCQNKTFCFYFDYYFFLASVINEIQRFQNICSLLWPFPSDFYLIIKIKLTTK